MMRFHLLGALGVLIAFAWFARAASAHVSATVGDQVFVLTNGVGCALIMIAAIGVGIAAKGRHRRVVRGYAFAVIALAGIVALIPFVGTALRMEATRAHLIETYSMLADHGPPFPAQLSPEMQGDADALISHGYWVAQDGQTFEVYYHDGSDSFTMRFPNDQWEWRGNKYAGPKQRH